MIQLFHFLQDGIHRGAGSQVNTVLGDEVRRIGGTQLAHLFPFMCQVAQEEGNAYQCIPAVVAFGINHPAIAFASDDGIHLFHLGHDVHLSYCRGIVVLSVGTGHIAQGTCRTEI